MVIAADNLPTTGVDRQAYRIISARYPQIDLFERVATSQQWDLLYQVEALTNQRLRDEVGDIQLVPTHERVFGAGASWIMAAFTHPPRRGQGGRFNRDFGVYYCATDESTAIAETAYHRGRFLRDARIKTTEFVMRLIRAHVGPVTLHDARDVAATDPIYHLTNYSDAQRLGEALRANGSWGLIYQSVRNNRSCMAVMRPSALSNAVHLKFYRYRFEDGELVAVDRFR